MDRFLGFITTCVGSVLIALAGLTVLFFFLAFLLQDVNLCFTPESCAAEGNP